MTTHNMSVDLCGVRLKNPVMTASGTFGSGIEFSSFFDLNRLGAVVTKGVSSVPWEGNPTPRICETPSGMLNAIGLQNPGFDVFAKRDLGFLEETLRPDEDSSGIGTKVVVNVCGHSEEEYVDCVTKLAAEKRADLLEINISCPNVKEGGIAFGTDPKGVERITSVIRKIARQPVIMKLSPKDRRRTESICPGKQDRRSQWSGDSPGSCPHGVPVREGRADSDHRNGRDPDCRGCAGDADGRCHGGLGRDGFFPRPDDSTLRDRWNPEVPGAPPDCGCQGADRVRGVSL